MANHRISNLMPSPLDLSAITDVNGNPITLRPVNTPGASREIAGETTHHEVVQRVVSAGWAKVEKIAVAVAAAPPARVMQPLSDVIGTIEAPVEPIVMAAEETPAVETASEVPAEATADVAVEEPAEAAVDVAVEEPAEAAVDVAGEEPVAEVSATPAARSDDSRRNRRNR